MAIRLRGDEAVSLFKLTQTVAWKKKKGWPKTSEITAKQALSRRDTRIIIKNKDQARAFSSQAQKYIRQLHHHPGLTRKSQHVLLEAWSWPSIAWRTAANQLQWHFNPQGPQTIIFTVFISILPSSPSWEPGNLLAWEPQKHASMSNSLPKEATLGHPGWMNVIDTVGPKAIWRLMLLPGASPWAHSHSSAKTSRAHGLCLYCTTAAVHSLPKA